MTGPEHYKEAERLLAMAVETTLGESRNSCVVEAQVHATLALAAASVQWTADGCTETVAAPDWRRMLILGELPRTT
jgi:hypothetical protein